MTLIGQTTITPVEKLSRSMYFNASCAALTGGTSEKSSRRSIVSTNLMRIDWFPSGLVLLCKILQKPKPKPKSVFFLRFSFFFGFSKTDVGFGVGLWKKRIFGFGFGNRPSTSIKQCVPHFKIQWQQSGTNNDRNFTQFSHWQDSKSYSTRYQMYNAVLAFWWSSHDRFS